MLRHARTIGLAALALASGCGPHPGSSRFPEPASPLAARAPALPPLSDGLPSGTLARLELDLVTLRTTPFGAALEEHLARVARALGVDLGEGAVESALGASRSVALSATVDREGTLRWLALARGEFRGELAIRLASPDSLGASTVRLDDLELSSVLLGDHTWLVGHREAVDDSARRLTQRLPPVRPRDAATAALDLIDGGTADLAFSVDLSSWDRVVRVEAPVSSEPSVGPLAVSGSIEVGVAFEARIGVAGPDAVAAARAVEGWRGRFVSLSASAGLEGVAAAFRDATVEARPGGAVVALRLGLPEARQALAALEPLVVGLSTRELAPDEDDEPRAEGGRGLRSPRPGRTADSTALVDALAGLGFFEAAGSPSAVHDAEKWARETGWPFDPSSGRVFDAAPEDLVDGGLETLFAALQPFLARVGVHHEVSEAPTTDDLVLVVDGRRILLATEEELDDPCWSEVLGLRITRLVDRWFEAVGSKERAYFLEPDGDRPRLVLLSPDMMARIRRHPDYDPDTWPMRLTDDPVPGCEDAYARTRSP